MERYLATNHFMTSINNEIPARFNQTYKDNLLALEGLVLVLFDRDKTVVPMESGWFGSYAIPDEKEIQRLAVESERLAEQASDSLTLPWPLPWQDPPTVIPMRQQPLYLDDTIGLRTLDEAGKVYLEACAGEHMQLPKECWEPIVSRFCGSGPEPNWRAGEKDRSGSS